MYTATDLSTIQEAIATGTRRVRFTDGREVEYNSVKDLLIAKADIATDLAGNSPSPIVRRIKIYTTKDF